MNNNFRKAKVIEHHNKQRLLRANPYLDEKSGIYVLTREDEDGIRYAYIGQAKHILWNKNLPLLSYNNSVFGRESSNPQCYREYSSNALLNQDRFLQGV